MRRLIKYFRHPSFTAAQWTTRNPYLQKGEIAVTIDALTELAIGYKIGPGYWNDLAYLGADYYPYADVVTNPIGDVSGVIQNQKLIDIIKKMVSPYQVPAITGLGNNGPSGGGFVLSAVREIGLSLPSPLQLTFAITSPANLSGATPINITANGVFTNEGNFANALPISLNLSSPLNPAGLLVVTIKLKLTHQQGVTSDFITTLSFQPKIMWGNSALDTLNGTQFMAISNKGTLVTTNYKNDYQFQGNGYSWLAIPSMLGASSLQFIDVTVPGSTANYAMQSMGTISINNGVGTYNYDMYRSVYSTINPSKLRVA